MNLFETTITEQAKKNVMQVLDSGFLNQGKFVDQFEDELSEFGLSNPLTLNSCTSALHLALLLSHVEQDDEVIIPAQTFVSTGLSVLMCKAKPVFADVDLNGNLDPEDVKKKVTKKTKAVIVVHWGGTPAQMDKMYDVCRSKGLWLIEDAAHALGATYDGQPIGSCSLSNFCCFSLQSIKTLTSGDGGILCINDKYTDAIEKAGIMRWFGMDKKNIVRNENGERDVNIDTLGFKYHMNDFNAALGVGNMSGLGSRIRKRRQIAEIFNSMLQGVEILTKYPKAVSSYWLYTIKVDQRSALIRKMKSLGIPVSTVDTRIDKNRIFKNENWLQDYEMKEQFTPYYLPNQTRFDDRQVSIPCHDKLTIDDIMKIIDAINGGW